MLLCSFSTRAHAATTLQPPPPGIPAATQTRINVALAKLHTAQASLANSQPELARHQAAADAALKQVRSAPKTATPAELGTSLATAKAEYAAVIAQLALVQKQAGDARDAGGELRSVLPTKNASPALLKAVGSTSWADANTKWEKASAAASKTFADLALANAAAAQVNGALAAPNAHGPAQCDIRKTDWSNMKYPATDPMPTFQLKNANVNVDGGEDPMNNSRVTWSFTFVQVDYADTNENGVTEAFVRVDEAGAGYEQLSNQLLFAFEDDASCTPKPIASAELGNASATRMTPAAYLETSQDGATEWRLSGKRIIQTAIGAPLPVCQAGLPPGTFKNGKRSLSIPGNCTDVLQWWDEKAKHIGRPGVSQALIDGQMKAVLYSAEGDVCARYALTPSKSGGITITWQPDTTGSISRNPTVIRSCSANNGEYHFAH